MSWHWALGDRKKNLLSPALLQFHFSFLASSRLYSRVIPCACLFPWKMVGAITESPRLFRGYGFMPSRPVPHKFLPMPQHTNYVHSSPDTGSCGIILVTFWRCFPAELVREEPQLSLLSAPQVPWSISVTGMSSSRSMFHIKVRHQLSFSEVNDYRNAQMMS